MSTNKKSLNKACLFMIATTYTYFARVKVRFVRTDFESKQTKENVA